MSPRPSAFPVRVLVAAACFATAVPAAAQLGGDDAETSSAAALPGQVLTPQIFYQVMLAEVAAARGQGAAGAQAYLDLARRTRDPRLARRAAELAALSRKADLAGEAAQLWLELDPASPQAQQVAAGFMASSAARIDALRSQLAKALATQGDQTGPVLLSLNRGLARIPDKALVRTLVFELTEPYLLLPEAHFARSNAAYVAGDARGALTAIDSALAIRPDWEQAVLLKAQLLQEVVAPAQGQTYLKDYLAAHPDGREARLTLARMLVADRQFGAALEQFRALLQRLPDDRDVVHATALLSMQQGDTASAEKLFRHLLDLGFGDADQIRAYLGQIAEDGKRPDEALGWYRSVKPGTQYLPAQTHIAQILAAQGRLGEARQHLHQGARENPADRVAYLLTEAQILRDAGRNAESFELLDDALRTRPDDPDLLYESALMAERLGHIDVMEGRLRKLIALKPEHAHAYNALGYSLADRGLRLDEAETLIARGLALSPEDPFILDSLGWVRYRKGDLAGALAALQKAYGVRADPEIAAHLGEVLWTLGRRDEAAQTWRDALKAHPDNTVLSDVLKKFKP
ncbi:MAG TPA: tetratricopeptide repeat protein [Rhodocyclaceae bacterium]|nr:tetratricopeptide repeat protein [Rhodocyclaceae bacterium]HMZ75859.1 tetratricopeptide repeat protein [Rhodocyclaceae bacterium]HNE15052.1 tetratricopeptide repeat protein [Rhodocyclaceae bacterium]HNF60316.1 tetratricopeptide repeat protein [Rhodocyclaceae bacterium]HNO86939.1 tetratricopeptide repeat protein [Rhodocyclaceae bacterium]